MTEVHRGSVDGGDVALQTENFDPSSYIRERLKGVRMGDEARKLQGIRSEMSTKNHESSETLKNNVFRNYTQFIDAKNEITHVESEIYQLSALLTEQRALIENLMQMTTDDKGSIHTVSSTSTFNAGMNTTQLLLQKIDGIAAMLNSMKANEKVLLHGEVTLLDPDTKQRSTRSYLVLLPDRLLVAVQNPLNPSKFSLESTFALNTIAAVNVKDRESGGGDSAGLVMKLLVFPDQRYYRADTARQKQSWLEEIEGAKRAQLREGGLQRQATIRGKRRTVKEMAGGHALLRPIKDEVEDNGPDQFLTEESTAWLLALPAELDDCIAHRDLDAAAEMIREWKEEVRGRDAVGDAQVVLRENQLVQMLADDVRKPGSAHGGPRAMHRARGLLAALGRGTYAVDLYLQRRSTMLKAAYKDVTVSEEPLAHVRALTSRYSATATDVLDEFKDHPEHYAQVLQFCSRELFVLLGYVRKNVIEVVPTLAILSRTWRILMAVCDEMTAYGAQLTFEMHRVLGPAIEDALHNNFEQIIHTFRLRMADEQWKGAQLESEAALHRLCEEFSDIDLRIDWAEATSTSLHISDHVLDASKQALTLAVDLAPLRSSPLSAICDSYVMQLWTELLSVFTGTDTEPGNEPQPLLYSANFVLAQVLPACEQAYFDEGEERLTALFREQFPELARFLVSSQDPAGQAPEDDEEEEEEVATC